MGGHMTYISIMTGYGYVLICRHASCIARLIDMYIYDEYLHITWLVRDTIHNNDCEYE